MEPTPQPFRIEPATAEDIPQLLPLMAALADFEHYRDSFAITEEVLLEQGFTKNPPNFHCLVARQGDALRGMLVYYFIPYTATAKPALAIKELFIEEAGRGQGMGAALMQAVAQIAVAKGCGAVKWAVADWNTAGRRFYESLGAKSNPVWIDYSLSGAALQELAAAPSDSK